MTDVAAFLGVAGEPVRWEGKTTPDLRRLVSLAPWLTWEDADSGLRVVSRRLAGSVRWVSPPEGRMLESLVLLSRGLATGHHDWDTPATPVLVGELTGPVELTVTVGPRCAFCPAVEGALLRFAAVSPHIDLTVRNAARDPSPGLQATPTVTLGGRVIHVGAGAEYPLAECLVSAASR